jgi:hypothetical protein
MNLVEAHLRVGGWNLGPLDGEPFIVVLWVGGPCRRMRRDGLWMFMVVQPVFGWGSWEL